MRRFFLILIVVCAGMAWPAEAAAQKVGVRGGVSADPDQFYVGLHLVTKPVFDRVEFRPNVELGIGDNATLIALNGEFVYRRQINKQPWSLLAGGGPGAVIRRRDGSGGDRTDTGGGLNVLIGAEHAGGFFTELKVGLIDSPSVKFGVGFTFR
ncbi:MAG: hypothetical protein EPO35_00395 [Acidobacteria bacterium]|nr:MAG: hypothetical protein EPO35_00395 [Acidobacteriota bacterium]